MDYNYKYAMFTYLEREKQVKEAPYIDRQLESHEI